jgi:hypothetical protein
MGKRKKNGNNKKGGNSMSSAINKPEDNLKAKLKKISAKAPILKGKGSMVELDPNNKQHREWFLQDKYKGQ